MEIIKNDAMPAAGGHYSHCVAHNGILYLSGQLPIDQVTKTIPESIGEQTDMVMENVNRVLEAAGSTKNDVIQVRIFITNIEYWNEVNTRYAAFFGDHKPARCIIPSRDLHYGCLIEVEAIAVQND
ncbi:MAG: RidA family protein [Saprospiraceae bacterium]|nr:RidA family protein [Saprospiraceae bacterium]MBL0024305.1 RidA family protein [Saprospiraceae bacterium]